MKRDTSSAPSCWLLIAFVSALAGFGGAALYDRTGFADDAMRDYILAHPEILPEAMEVLRSSEQQAQLDPMRTKLETPFPGAVLGNPDGTVTLVEFTDYACGYCRKSVDDVKAVIAENPDLRVVIHEMPILSPESAAAARMALAAAEQGKFAAFHDAMFAMGSPNEKTIAAAAREAGIDFDQASQDMANGQYDQRLQANIEMASSLGFQGTPSWVVGDQVLSGAQGKEKLAEAIAASQENS